MDSGQGVKLSHFVRDKRILLSDRADECKNAFAYQVDVHGKHAHIGRIIRPLAQIGEEIIVPGIQNRKGTATKALIGFFSVCHRGLAKNLIGQFSLSVNA